MPSVTAQGMGNMPMPAAAPDASTQGMAPAQGMAPMQGGGMMGMMPMMMSMMGGMPVAGMDAAAPMAPADDEFEEKVDELSQMIATLVERLDRMETSMGGATPPAPAR